MTSTDGIAKGQIISSFNHLPIGSSPTDLMAYVETLLIQDYDDQMRDIANSIKINNRLKQAYREHKIKVNDLLGKEQKDGEVELNPSELNLLNSKPDFLYDESMNDGAGGVKDYNTGTEDVFAISNQDYIEEGFDNDETPIAANETAGWWGDPHFFDADGVNKGEGATDWDFQGIAGETYNMISDTNFRMDATFQASGGQGKTVVGSTAITINGPTGDSHIVFDAKTAPTFNGETMVVGQSYETEDGKAAIYDGSILSVKTAEGYLVKIEDKGNYLNGSVTSDGNGVSSDDYDPTGLLGQTFDADTNVSFIGMGQQNIEQSNSAQFKNNAAVGNGNGEQLKKVKIDTIKSEMERLQMKLDGLNSETELAQVDLSTITSQRKLAFETMSTMISKVFEAASTVVRNIK